MAEGKDVLITLPPEAVEAAEALVEPLGRFPEYRAFRLTRAAVLRLAVLEGLETLKQKAQSK